MTFLNPLFLFGLAAAALPLLIHLLNLRKLRVIEFSSLRFLKELQHTRIRRVKIRQILLLILRTLLVIVIVLAFSRPALQGNLAGLVGTEARSTMVILLDDSPSMSVRTQSGTIFSEAKTRVSELVRVASAGDRIYVLPLSESWDELPVPARSAQEVLSLLETMDVSHRSVPLMDGLRRVSAILAEADHINREVYVVSDGQRSQFRREQKDSLTIGDNIRLFFLSAMQEETIPNRGVAAVTSGAQVITPSRPLNYTARLVNTGNEPVPNLLMSVYLDRSRVAQRSVALPANSSASSTFAVTPQKSGVLSGTVELEEDRFDLDNRRYFTLDVPATIRVGLIGSAEDTRFTSLALSAAAGDGFGKLFSVKKLDESAIGSVDFSSFDALVFAGIRDLSVEEGARIASFVRSGGGIALFPGSETDPVSISRNLFTPLGLPGLTAGSVLSANGPGGSLSFGSVDLEHPLFSGLFEERIGSRQQTADIESPAITRTIGLVPGNKGTTVIGLSDGAPFLVEYGAGSGRVLAFAVDAAMRWSDFGLKGLFAPLMHRAMIYLVTGRSEGKELVVGDAATISIRASSAAGTSYGVMTPDGLLERVTPAVNPLTGMMSFTLPATRIAGIYTLYRETDTSRPLGAAAVNIDERESMTERIAQGDMESFFDRLGIGPDRLMTVDEGSPLEQVVRESRYGVELWKTMIAIALFLAVAEMAIARVTRREISDEGSAP